MFQKEVAEVGNSHYGCGQANYFRELPLDLDTLSGVVYLSWRNTIVRLNYVCTSRPNHLSLDRRYLYLFNYTKDLLFSLQVDAAVVRLVKRPSFQIPFDELKTTVQQLFMYPRKTLKTSLRIQQLLLQGDQLPATIPTDARPGTLTHTQILAMVKWFKSRKEQILPKTLQIAQDIIDLYIFKK